ncbi:MAG: glycosyltransferase family 39 protein [Anaerolineae bacterium]|nr:glycosyltransferase family 39 protein [Anaerolineae bacterium]MDW8070295.1 glycosyltransferase family 39 protein [Anaerolineae bacterium]
MKCAVKWASWSQRHAITIATSIVVLLAFALRVYRLDAQSYWIDEGWTLHYAALTPAELWHTLQTTRVVPPLYHFLTLYWSALLGYGEYAMRFLSVLCGTLSVPLAMRLGGAFGDARLGFLTALLIAVSPYQIWHSQDARNYTMLTAAALMSMWSFVTLWQGQRGWQWQLLYILGTEWALLTHYHALILIGVQALFLLVTWFLHPKGTFGHRQLYLRWSALVLITFGLFGLWLYFGLGALKDYYNWIPQPKLWETYVRSALAYSVGELVPMPLSVWLSSVFVGLFLGGCVYAARRSWQNWHGRHMLALIAIYTLTPNLAAWLYGAVRTPVYLERYLIPVQGSYLLAVAMGVLAISEGAHTLLERARLRGHRHLATGLGALSLSSLLGISGWVLYHHYFDPTYAKPDWRTIAHTIEDYTLPGDAILITGAGSEMVFDYYYKGDLPVYAEFNHPSLSADDALQRLVEIVAQHRRIWYMPYGLPVDHVLEEWLMSHAYPAWQSWLGRQRMALYVTKTAFGMVERPVDIAFEESPDKRLELLRVATPARPVAAGDVAPFVLTWQTTAQLAYDYQVSMRLINARGERYAQADWPPLAAEGRTSTWRPGQAVVDRRALWLPADTPPGRYQVQLVVYEPGSGRQLGLAQSVTALDVAPAHIIVPVRSLQLPNSVRQKMGELILVGYALPGQLQPGEDIWMHLYWQLAPDTQVTRLTEAIVRLTLESDEASEQKEMILPLADLVGDPIGWRPGQVRRALYRLPTNPRLSVPQVTLHLDLLWHGERLGDRVSLPPIALQQRPRRFDPPRIVETAQVALGEPPILELVGYEVAKRETRPGDTLEVTLHWHALAEVDEDYTVFVQLLDPDWRVVAQQDRQPLAGLAPTSTWLHGEFLSDPYHLYLPADLPPGQYRLITGMYQASDGQRLPVSTGGDFIDLGMVRVW